MRYELIVGAYLAYFWCMTAWNSLYRITRGKIRLIEDKNEELAEKMEVWRDNQTEYNQVFRIIFMLTVSIMGISVFQYLEVHLAEYKFTWNMLLLISVGVLCLLFLFTALLIRFIVRKFDVKILSFTLPLVGFIFKPVMKISDWLSGLLEQDEAEAPSIEDEIMSFVENDDEANEDGALEEEEKRMIKGIFDLDDTQVREIMTPRVDLVALSDAATFDEARKKFVESGHSRIPIYSGTVDEIKGILYAKDFLEESAKGKSLIDMAHQPLFVPESKNVSSLLKEFRHSSIHVAVIIDEYGGTSGVATLEDILEKIVGEIRDEYDDVTDGGIQPITLEDGSVIFEARSLISEVNDFLDINIPEDENVDTIGGFVSSEFGRIPASGEVLNMEGIARITVVKSDPRKVISVKINIVEEE